MIKHKSNLRLKRITLILTTALYAGAVFADTTYALEIPTQRLDLALQSLAQQSGAQILFVTKAVNNYQSETLNQELTVEQALQQLLKGKNLQIKKITDNKFSIVEGQPQARDMGQLKPIDVVATGSTSGNVAQLPVIVVEATEDNYVNDQFARKARVGLLGEKDLIDIPFNVSSYSSETITNSHALTVADVLIKDSSVQSTHSSGGFLDSFIIRGFPIGEGNLGEIAWEGQYGVAPNYRLLTPYIENIEVLKGPAAMLYGMSPNGGVGGTINIIPKRALEKKLTRLTLDYSTDSNVGAHVDLSRRFGQKRQFGIRFNTSHHEGNTAIKNQSRDLSTAAIALDYKGKQLNSTLDLVWQKEQLDNPIRPYYLASGVALPAAPDGRYTATQKWGWSKVEDLSVALQNTYDVTENTSIFFNIGGAKSEVGRLVDHTVSIINDQGDTSAMLRDGIFKVDRFSTDVGVRTNFQMGDIDHAITVQLSKYQDKYSMSLPTGSIIYSNIYHPIYISQPEYIKVTDVPLYSRSKLSGVGVSDTLSMLNEKLMLTLGLRQQYVETTDYRNNQNYKQHALTPLVAIVYNLTDNTSLYANHIQGLSKGDRAPDGSLNEGETLQPYKSKQFEMGIKYQNDQMFTSLSAFTINKPSGQLTNGYYSANAEQQNTGIEFNAYGDLSSSLAAYGNLTYLNAELTHTNNINTQGNRAVGTPEWRGHIGLEWDTSLSGLTLGSSFTYVDRQPVDQVNTQYLPAWTRLDLNSRYVTRIGNQDVTFRANLLNALNKKYWSGVASYSTIALGIPRTFSLSATFDF